jgi:hypothetical protein
MLKLAKLFQEGDGRLTELPGHNMLLFSGGVMIADDGGYDPEKSILNAPEIVQVSDNAIEVTIETMNMSEEPSLYKVNVKNITSSVSFPLSPDPTSSTFTIPNLIKGNKYKLEIVAYFASENQETQVLTTPVFTMDEEIAGQSLLGNSTDPVDINSNFYKGYLTLSSKETDDKKNTIATKTFESITLPTSTQVSLPGGKNTVSSYDTKYYSFGTSFRFAADLENGKSGAGIGFFADERGNKGYYLMMETSASAAEASRKTLRWVKLVKGKTGVETLAETINVSIFAAEIYNVDIRVKISGKSIEMNAYINGIKFSATDTSKYDTGTKKVSKIVAPTKVVALLCTRGKVYYDYVYALDIDEKKFSDVSAITNKYSGRYSKDLLSNAFGELKFQEGELPNNTKNFIDEFGTVVREIRKFDVQFRNSPAYPIGWDTGISSAVSILAQEYNNFSSKVWVMNNSSTTTPLSDGEKTSFYLYGNPISEAATLEYETKMDNDYTIKRPVVFETRWVQRLEDAQALGDWIKSQIINKGRIVKMAVFGNPLIQIGDIVSVKYPYQNFNGTEAMIVTEVINSFEQGISTQITCRTI